ncbi:MAG: hypothetical protein ACRDZ3_20405 [Acidimicrobiia bacterium]
MTLPSLSRPLVTLVALLPILAAAGWNPAPTPGTDRDGLPVEVAGAVELAETTFRVDGNLQGLYPGGTLPLVITLTNHNEFAISVTSVAVSVDGVNPDCPGTLVVPGPFPGPVPVPGDDHSIVKVPLHMAGDTPADCEGAKFSLAYDATAIRL